MNEADTRAELIDPQLASAGWITGDDVRVQREYTITDGEIQTGGMRSKNLRVDYVLSYKNVKLAVVEAKSDEIDVSEGIAQAKNYATKLRLDKSFSANGKEIYQICHKTGQEGKINAFPSPDELWQKSFGQTNEWLEKISSVPFEVDAIKQTRYYQEIAINRTCEAIANEQNRILLTLTTGTGKTFIAFQIAWKLFHSRWTLQRDGKRRPRILFLTDRNILADQAYSNFGAFKEDVLMRINSKKITKKGEVPTNANIFFTIFQTLMGEDGSEKHFQAYDPDFFDLVIIDECHRGGANDESTWRKILEYFDKAVHLGLTATPKRQDNVDTYDYFGKPIFIYSLKEGVQDGFLTPFKVRRIQSNIDEYVYSPDDEVLEGEVDKGHVYTEAEINKKIKIEERERHRVKNILANINPKEKTIIFCANQDHAGLIRNLINQEAKNSNKNSNVDYCARVTAKDKEIGEAHLRQFQDNEKTIPTILTTSQKLSTGVDARNIRNIVLLRTIKSMIEFKQIIGRGTRLFEGKDFFTILDFVGAYHLFSDPEWDGEPIEPEQAEEQKNKKSLQEKEEKQEEQEEQEKEEKQEEQEKEEKQEEQEKEEKEEKIPTLMGTVNLSDSTIRNIQTMVTDRFLVDGDPYNAESYIKYLFDKAQLPKLFENEEKLREIWANPNTRKQLLNKLKDLGCGNTNLLRLQELINAEDSDLFDVLRYIAYNTPSISREERVEKNESNIYNLLNKEQKEFVKFVLKNYIKSGVNELDISRLGTIAEIKYGSAKEAKQKLGDADEIRKLFIDFQKHLYKKAV